MMTKDCVYKELLNIEIKLQKADDKARKNGNGDANPKTFRKYVKELHIIMNKADGKWNHFWCKVFDEVGFEDDHHIELSYSGLADNIMMAIEDWNEYYYKEEGDEL